MKNLLLSFACVLFLLPLLSVAASLIEQPDSRNRLLEEENRSVGPFSGVASAVSFNVFVTIGPKESVRLEGDKETLAKIETVVKNKVLHIKMKKENESWFSSAKKVNIYVTAPSLNTVAVSGSGNMTVEGTVKGEHVTTDVSGSGQLSATVASTNLSAGVSGSGGMELKGQTTSAQIEISGSGKFEGEDLKSRMAKISVSGSGKASIQAEENLDAFLSGSGKIRYSGNAKVNVVKSGSGTVSKI